MLCTSSSDISYSFVIVRTASTSLAPKDFSILNILHTFWIGICFITCFVTSCVSCFVTSCVTFFATSCETFFVTSCFSSPAASYILPLYITIHAPAYYHSEWTGTPSGCISRYFRFLFFGIVPPLFLLFALSGSFCFFLAHLFEILLVLTSQDFD